jgi:secondary thiamine-phosphate synthase enzyme
MGGGDQGTAVSRAPMAETARNRRSLFCSDRHTEITWPEMHVHHEELEIRTNEKGLYEITDQVQSKIDRSGAQTGTVTVFVQHTSCSVVIMENADPTARRDLEKFFDRLVPEDAHYFSHSSEGSDDMPSHIRTVLTRTSETVPVLDGKMRLGTWQGIFLFEHRRAAHRRKVFITLIGE